MLYDGVGASLPFVVRIRALFLGDARANVTKNNTRIMIVESSSWIPKLEADAHRPSFDHVLVC